MAADLEKEKLLGLLGDWRWRLNNLYYIVDERGQRVKFQMNSSQERLWDDLHYLNAILKARQLGFTTFIQIYSLDQCVFNSNIRAGTIAHTLDDAKIIFRDKIRYPYDSLPDQIKDAVHAKNDNTGELLLSNNSSIRVGTSLRSGTLQILHISEYGKICAKFPDKAREVRTGALNTVHAGQMVFIESTAEGQEGHFFQLCEEARAKKRQGIELTPLDYNFTFWPWYQDPRYRLTGDEALPEDIRRYFEQLEQQHGINLEYPQKLWYAKKAETQLADMKREYPSTPDEAFEASVEGAYYANEMARADFQGRIGNHPFIKELPVHTVWDIGRDTTAIWFWQTIRGKLGLVGYYQNSGEGAPFYVQVLVDYAKRRGWKYGNHWFPHDLKVTEWGTDRSRIESLIKLGVKPWIVPELSIEDGINSAREVLPFCYFDKAECEEGIKALRNYRKEWDENHSVWKDHPRHDAASHGADSFRYLSLAYRKERPPAPPKPPIDDMRAVTLDKLWKTQEQQTRGGMI